MSKTMSLNPLDYLRKSPTGAKIASEIEAVDEAAERRKAAAATVVAVNAKLDAAHGAIRKAMADERTKTEAAKRAYDAAVGDARRATNAARAAVHSLERQRDNAERHLRETADPRIAEFRADVWAKFQSRRNSIPSLIEHVPTGRKHPITGLPIDKLRNNVAALTRWTATVTSVMSKAEALKRECLDASEVESRLAALQADIDAAEAAATELADAGDAPGDTLAIEVLSAKPIDREPKRGVLERRYQLVESDAE